MATAQQIADIEGRLALYLEAEAAVLRNQSYKMPNGREMTRAQLKDIRAGIAEIRSELSTAQGAPVVRGRMRRGVILG